MCEVVLHSATLFGIKLIPYARNNFLLKNLWRVCICRNKSGEKQSRTHSSGFINTVNWVIYFWHVTNSFMVCPGNNLIFSQGSYLHFKYISNIQPEHSLSVVAKNRSILEVASNLFKGFNSSKFLISSYVPYVFHEIEDMTNLFSKGWESFHKKYLNNNWREIITTIMIKVNLSE